MARALLGLCMILKDEEQSIRVTLESVKAFIDEWTIVDTGSTDRTVEVVKEALAGVPGSLVQRPFAGYATSRNEVLTMQERAPLPEGRDHAAYTLMLSADEVLQGGERLRVFLHGEMEAGRGQDAYCVTMRDELVQWPYPRLLRSGGGWRYIADGQGEDEIHEQPVGPQGEIDCPVVSDVVVRHAETNRPRKLARLHADVLKMRKVVEDEARPLANRVRSMLHLAKTYAVIAANEPRDPAGKHLPGGRWLTYLMEAMGLFYRCGQIYEQEDSPAYDAAQAMYCYFLYYDVAERAGVYEHHELVPRLAIVAEASPRLPEVHYNLARHVALSERTTQLISPENSAKKGLALAVKAAKVAHAAKASPSTVTADARMEWLSLKLAAFCARDLKDEATVKKIVARALEAGGPREEFQAFGA